MSEHTGLSNDPLAVVPLGPVGAEVRNVDVSRLDEQDVETIKAAWYRHDVLVFRGQHLDSDQLIAFSRRFGVLDTPPNQSVGKKSPPGYPDIYVVSNLRGADGEPLGALGDGECAWHSDSSFLPHPHEASLLYALEVPPSGGDTSFAGMKQALAALPPALRARLDRLDLKHDGTYDSSDSLRKGVVQCDDPRYSVGAPHPAIIEHPVSRQPALYLGRRRNAYYIGLELDESERLLDDVWRYVDTAVYRHRWQAGDLLMWDNRSLLHRREAFDSAARRVMHRTQVKGLGPLARAKAA
ncbi:TauD/TfdA dioxygenase family protein [Burkholderia plantarii]|uniref:TauD/TfdA dioxygenase family protein n=1 Tax=Burkholderia plantarii TaxID=41899 RepID=UPI0008709143|nr:TauD/TfdA family dioxygenase [Burkholderia plantarii]